ncbi:hypothetical protein EV191_11365 [Tamaricihabitans halophyticus]|uniref:Uncharacterized protein n=1 Tax=Tamaricihabitans halophyticus TaxID=1262583 RepID=A0A4R2QDS7_9PSEU|nr:hypothetical protein [Tamaricihabitans halophyticus]TCP46789.1 hypothetical protein EV191_11365 [Tamaricihabitans halophyticus]
MSMPEDSSLAAVREQWQAHARHAASRHAEIEQCMHRLWQHGPAREALLGEGAREKLLNLATGNALHTEALTAMGRGDLETGNEHLERAKEYLREAELDR